MQTNKGRYQTRSNRVVDITGSRIVDRHQPGNPNPVPTRMWVGILFQMDGRTPESEYTWTDAGGFYGTAQGVASPQDLVNRISPPVVEDPEPAPKNANLESILSSLQDNIGIAQKALEDARDTLGLIRFRAVEALGKVDNPSARDEALKQIVDLVNEAIEEKVPA